MHTGDLKIDAQRVTKKQVAFISFYKKKQICEDSKRQKKLWFGCSLMRNLSQVWAWVVNCKKKNNKGFVYTHFSALNSLTLVIRMSVSLAARCREGTFHMGIYLMLSGDRERGESVLRALEVS